jgi:hypothetical protein
MIVQCPHCGGQVIIKSFRRRPLNIVVTKVCDELRLHRSVLTAANELGGSCAYIYKVLKADGLTPAAVIKRFATKDNSLLYNGGLNGRW